MNEKNYCSLEMSRKLPEAGIVLHSEKEWIHVSGGGWYLVERNSEKYDAIDKRVPAPSMAELWREVGDDVYLTRHWHRDKRIYQTRATLTFLASPEYTEENPCDALAALLIWIKEAKR